MTHFASLPSGFPIGTRYVIETQLGRGMSSAVYRARDLQTQTCVALKVLDPFLAQDATHLERFRREVTILRTLEHPHIVKIHSFFQAGELHIIAMEYVEGGDAATLVRRRGALAVDEFLRIARGASDALAVCHRNGVLHRDLKPQNLLIDPHGEPRLVDFGVAKISTMSDLTKTGTVIGSPEYMAPELFLTTRSDPRSDVYSLGALFYELLTERPPYSGGSLGAVLARQLEGPPDPIHDLRSDVPEWIEAVVAKCLRLEADSRFQSPGEVLAELNRGERALSLSQDRSSSVDCLSCSAVMVPGLSFCWQCGAGGATNVGTGSWSIVLNRIGDRPELERYLLEAFPKADAGRLSRILKTSPSLLLRHIDEAAARSLSNALIARSCDVGLVDRLPTQFRLPRGWALAVAALSPGVLFACATALGQNLEAVPVSLLAAVVVATGELGVLALYRRRIRPGVALRGAAGPGPNEAEEHEKIERAHRLWRALSAVDDPRLRRTLGHLAAQLMRISEQPNRESSVGWSQDLRIDGLEELVLRAMRSAVELQRYEAYLSDRSLMEIKDRSDAVDLRIERATTTDELDPLIKTQVELAEELRHYREIEDLHSRTQLCILSVGGALELVEGALRRDENLSYALEELSRLDAALVELQAD